MYVHITEGKSLRPFQIELSNKMSNNRRAKQEFLLKAPGYAQTIERFSYASY